MEKTRKSRTFLDKILRSLFAIHARSTVKANRSFTPITYLTTRNKQNYI